MSLIRSIAATIRSPEAAEKSVAEEDVHHTYGYWRVRIMYSITIGYGVFYLVRKNAAVATKAICDEFGFSNVQWGLLLSLASIAYAFAKFFSGMVADRINPRYLMSIALFGSALMNLIFPFNETLIILSAIWLLNSLFQGFGMTPCSHLLTVWYGPHERGRAWGIWNISHQVGGAVIAVLSAYLIAYYGWRSAFFVPAVISLFVSFWLYNRLRDTPESLGLPPIDVHQNREPASNGPTKREKFWPNYKRYVLSNPWVWLVAIANFFIYIVRMGMLDWAPKFLQETRGFSVQEAGYALGGFQLAGVFGGYVAGWLSDKTFKGRRGPVSVFFMILLIANIFVIWFYPSSNVLLMCILLSSMGFLVYGPEMLIGVAASDFATKKAAASAVGLSGLFGYFGATLCGIITGYLVDHTGWNGALIFYGVSALIGTILLAFTWHKSHQ